SSSNEGQDILAYTINAGDGSLTQVQVVAVVNPDPTRWVLGGSATDLAISPDGRFLYAMIATELDPDCYPSCPQTPPTFFKVYSINQATGQLTLAQTF